MYEVNIATWAHPYKENISLLYELVGMSQRTWVWLHHGIYLLEGTRGRKLTYILESSTKPLPASEDRHLLQQRICFCLWVVGSWNLVTSISHWCIII